MKIHYSEKKVRPSRTLRGFSLFEMVIVMGIIGVITGSAIYLMGNVGENAKIQRVRGDFTSFKSALDLYKMNGRKGYPTTAQGLEALVKKPTSAPIPRDWSNSLKKEALVDPWGNKYKYQFPGSKNTKEPEITSAGANGTFGDDDDLSNQDD